MKRKVRKPPISKRRWFLCGIATDQQERRAEGGGEEGGGGESGEEEVSNRKRCFHESLRSSLQTIKSELAK